MSPVRSRLLRFVIRTVGVFVIVVGFSLFSLGLDGIFGDKTVPYPIFAVGLGLGACGLGVLIIRAVWKAMGRNRIPLSALDEESLSMYELALNLYTQGKYDEAVKLSSALTIANPKMPKGWSTLSAAYGKLERRDDAIQSAQKALSLDPGNELAGSVLEYAQHARIMRKDHLAKPLP